MSAPHGGWAAYRARRRAAGLDQQRRAARPPRPVATVRVDGRTRQPDPDDFSHEDSDVRTGP